MEADRREVPVERIFSKILENRKVKRILGPGAGLRVGGS